MHMPLFIYCQCYEGALREKIPAMCKCQVKKNSLICQNSVNLHHFVPLSPALREKRCDVLSLLSAPPFSFTPFITGMWSECCPFLLQVC